MGPEPPEGLLWGRHKDTRIKLPWKVRRKACEVKDKDGNVLQVDYADDYEGE